MSSRNPVIWHEGLFVKPQHFQQQARAAEAAVHQRMHSLNDALYGFSELELNSEYLSFGKVAITKARGTLRCKRSGIESFGGWFICTPHRISL